MAREYLWRTEEAGLPSGQFKASAEQFKLPAGLDYSEEKVGLKMTEEPWEITNSEVLSVITESSLREVQTSRC